MKRIRRRTLSKQTREKLRELTDLVVNEPVADQKSTSDALWKNRTNNAAFAEISKKLGQMASGRDRCMYCEDNQGSDIEHFYPRCDFPEKSFEWKNYLWACSICNSNEKRTQFPLQNGRPLLIDPTSKDPSEDPRLHLELLPSSGRFKARKNSTKGQPTIDTLHLNERDGARPKALMQGRYDAWRVFELLVINYALLMQSGDQTEAKAFAKTIQRMSFASVLGYLLDCANGPGKSRIKPEVLTALAAHPEIHRWTDPT